MTTAGDLTDQPEDADEAAPAERADRAMDLDPTVHKTDEPEPTEPSD
jgi:hypothetical protein